MQPSGFDVRPDRRVATTALLLVAVVTFAGAFAHWFRESLGWAIEFYSDATTPPAAASSFDRLTVAAIAAVAVAIAATIGTFVERRWSDHVGVEAVASSARGEGRRISMVASGWRALATWISSASMVSIGRESAIIEAGGAVGASSARRLGGKGDTMAAAGIAAAFAAAYHAPIAAIVYVEEHLGVRHSRRAPLFVVAGAVGGHVVASVVLGGGVIFPPVAGSRWDVLWLGLLTVVPAVLAARSFLELRSRFTATAVSGRTRVPRWAVIATLSVVAGLAVGYFPFAAGNGMDALRSASVGSTLTIALALSLGKLIGTTAALGAGAPGGVLTPTISVAAGFSLLTMIGAESFGMTITHPWSGMVAAMAVGVTVGLRSPFGAVVLVPELLGDYWLVLPVAIIVAVAWLLDRGIDRVVARVGTVLPAGVRDEDA